MDTNRTLTDQQIVDIAKGISFGKRSGSIIEVTKAAIEPDAMPYSASSNQYAVWGVNNNRPQQIIDENMQEGSSAGALRFKIWAHYGMGLQFYRKRIEKDKEIITPVLEEELPQEMQDFIFENDLENLQEAIISDFEWFSFYYLQYIPNKAKNRILQVKWQRAKDVRLGLRNKQTGKIDDLYLSGKWPDPRSEYATAPLFDKMNPFGKPNGIYRHQLPSIDKDYYPVPYWQSNLKWLAVAKRIPEWITANIVNSANIKYHIEIPEEYFISLYPEDRYTSREECFLARKQAEEQLKRDIDSMLAGEQNASKIFYTKFAVDANGEVLPGWKINTITNDIKDAAWLNAYGTAAVAICTAHGTPPDLQGLVLPSGLGTGSGSNIRESFNTYVQLHTVIPRQTTLEWFKFVKRFNKWPIDIHLGYKGIVLQTLDQNKSGFATQSEPTPTTENK